jgi:hypothetical protein
VPLVQGNSQLAEAQRQERAQEYSGRALATLRQAIQNGYRDADHMQKDTDLDPLRSQPEFQLIMRELESKAKVKTAEWSNTKGRLMNQQWTWTGLSLLPWSKLAARRPSVSVLVLGLAHGAQACLVIPSRKEDSSPVAPALKRVITRHPQRIDVDVPGGTLTSRTPPRKRKHELTPILHLSAYRHAVAITPVGPQQGSVRSPDSCDRGLPRVSGGSAPTSNVSRPAQRSLTLRPACSRDRLAVLCIDGFGDIITSIAAPIATGWSESCRAGLAPAEKRHLCTAHTDTIFSAILGSAVRIRTP